MPSIGTSIAPSQNILNYLISSHCSRQYFAFQKTPSSLTGDPAMAGILGASMLVKRYWRSRLTSLMPDRGAKLEL